MADATHHVPLTFSEGLAAVRRAALDPDVIPVKVVVGAVRAAVDEGPSRAMIDSWNVDSATGPAVEELAELIVGLRAGLAIQPRARAIGRRYHDAGLVAAAAIASVLAAESFDVPTYATGARLRLGAGRRLGNDLLGLAQHLHRSFGVIPDRWKALALQPRVVTRWWDAHDGALAPGALTGEEKWLAAAAFAEALGDGQLESLYSGFLVRQGWHPHDVEAAKYGRLSRMRKGFGPALRAGKEMLLGSFDRPRLELAGADLAPAAVAELVDVARLARGMVVIGALA